MSSLDKTTESKGQDRGNTSASEADLIARLRRGDEAAFLQLRDEHHTAISSIARMYAHDSHAVATITLTTWASILHSLDSHEPSLPLRASTLRIAISQCREYTSQHGLEQENAATWDAATAPEVRALEPDRFLPEDDIEYPHYWDEYPTDWQALSEDIVVSEGARKHVITALGTLSLPEREVVVLRDVLGCPRTEVSYILGVSDSNQLLLLHRGRSKVRAALEQYVDSRIGEP